MTFRSSAVGLCTTPPLALLALAALAIVAPFPARATTYVMPSDAALVDQADLVIEGTVEEASDVAGPVRPLTEARVRAGRALKGRSPGSEVGVRVLGGRSADGRRLVVWGMPKLRPGDRVILFLAASPDGTFSPLHLGLGVFHLHEVAGRRLALRDLGGAQVLAPDGGPAYDTARAAERFARWIADRAAGKRRAPDYAVAAPPQLGHAVAPFSFLGGQKHRWFEFDAGVEIGWFAHVDGQQGLAGGGFGEFQDAIAAWNADPTSNVHYRYDGTTTASAGFEGGFDGINAILFDDPNAEIGGTFFCSSPGVGSGTLAVGGAWVSGVQGDAAVIAGGDIVVNDGAGCWFVTGKRAEQVYGHELGHTLGLGHSCGDSGPPGPCPTTAMQEALMRAQAHADNRGASFTSDDRAGIRSLYPAAASFFTVTPCRLADTRHPAGPFGGPALADGVVRTFTVGGNCGLPSTAGAAALNLTVVGASGSGHLTIFSPDLPAPLTSTINFAAGQTRANNAVIPLSLEAAARLSVLSSVSGGGQVHLIVDVTGYFE